jgi:hypothetical protein
VSELSDTLADTFNFFTDSLDLYNRSYLSRLLTKIDLTLKLLLRQFIRDSLKEWVDFLQSFLAPIRPRRLTDAPPSSLLSIKITTRNGKVSLEPSPEELTKAVGQLVASIPDALKPLVGCAHEMVPCLNFEPARLYKMPPDETVLKSTRTVTLNIFNECLKRPWDLKTAYSKYNYLLQAKVPDDFDPMHCSASMPAVRESISKLLKAADEVEMISASVEIMPLFEVQCSEVIHALTTHARGVANQMLEMVNQSVEVRLRELQESWEVALKTVKAVPQNEEELSTLKEYVGPPGGAGIVKKMVIDPNSNALRWSAKKDDPDTSVASQINLLNDFKFPELRQEVVEEAYDMLHWQFTIAEAVEFRKGEIEIEKQVHGSA